jgi:ATP-dependent protease Clp ATPase subunit
MHNTEEMMMKKEVNKWEYFCDFCGKEHNLFVKSKVNDSVICQECVKACMDIIINRAFKLINSDLPEPESEHND